MELQNNNQCSSIISAIETFLTVPAKPAASKRHWSIRTTTEMPSELIDALRSNCIVIERTHKPEIEWSDAQTEWGTEAVTVPIPRETCYELVYGK